MNTQKNLFKQEFEKWNQEKILLNKNNNLRTYREWELWYISMWKNIWFEQDWKWEKFLRPVLIFKKFNKNIFYWIPLTTKEKNNIFHFWFINTKWKQSFAILSQMRLFDSKRLLRNIWSIKFRDLKILKQKIKELIS